MEIRVLKYFLAVCREGNMSKAASSLHLTQPTLSRQIADLERELGCELFVRAGRRAELTEQGTYLRRRAAEIVQLAEQTEGDLKAKGDALAGTVRIAAGESYAFAGIARVMDAFHRENPDVNFAVHSGNAEDVSWRLDQGLADFAVFISYPSVGDYGHVRLSAKDEFGLLVPAGHPLSMMNSVGPSDLSRIPLIAPENILDSGPIATWFGSMRDKTSIIATYSLAYNAAIMVKEGLGCALVLDKIVPTGKKAGLALVPLKPKAESVIDLAWKRHQPLAAAPRAFLDALLASDSVEG